jgi:hypothetical protein
MATRQRLAEPLGKLAWRDAEASYERAPEAIGARKAYRGSDTFDCQFGRQ